MLNERRQYRLVDGFIIHILRGSFHQNVLTNGSLVYTILMLYL